MSATSPSAGLTQAGYSCCSAFLERPDPRWNCWNLARVSRVWSWCPEIQSVEWRLRPTRWSCLVSGVVML